MENGITIYLISSGGDINLKSNDLKDTIIVNTPNENIIISIEDLIKFANKYGTLHECTVITD